MSVALPRAEAGGAQRCDDVGDVFAIAGLQHELDFGGLHRQTGEGALMMDFVDVGAGLRRGTP